MNPAESTPTARDAEDAEASDRLPPGAWKIIAVVILAPFMTQMDATVVNVSLSSIAASLHASVATAHWIISGYLLAMALTLPVNGWLVDRVGTLRLYLGCFTAFTLASLLCATASDMNGLIVARLLQGIAGGLLAPLTQLMMARVAGKHFVKVAGYASAPVLLAPLCGPMLAGAILTHAGWPWLFYVNVPIGILAIILALRFVPPDEDLTHKRPFDWRGFLLISPGLVSLLYGFEQVSRHQGEGKWFLALGIILAVAFVGYARRMKAAALIDLALFKTPVFSVAAVTQFLFNGILYAGQFLIPLYLTSGCELGTVQTGWLLSAMGIGMLTAYPFMHALIRKFGYRAVATGGVSLNVLGTLSFLWMAHDGFSLPLAAAALFVLGIGQGSTGLPSIAAAYAAVPKERLSYATTAMNIVQRLGGPIVTTILSVVVLRSGTGISGPAATSFWPPFLALVVFQLLMMCSASRLPGRIEPNT